MASHPWPPQMPALLLPLHPLPGGAELSLNPLAVLIGPFAQGSPTSVVRGTDPAPLSLPDVKVEVLPSLQPIPAYPMLLAHEEAIPKPQGPKVGGHLHCFLDEWVVNDASPSALSIIGGLHLEFSAPPPLAHPHSAAVLTSAVSVQKQEILAEAIQTLIDKHATECAAPTMGCYASIFFVPKNNGKLRPVFNIKQLNHFMVPHSFKMATLKIVASAVCLGDFVVYLDLSDACCHVRIASEFLLILQFKSKGQILQFFSVTRWGYTLFSILMILSSWHSHMISYSDITISWLNCFRD